MLKMVSMLQITSIHNFDASLFIAVALDESSILKGFDGKTRKNVNRHFL